jgi:hypothetical protein
MTFPINVTVPGTNNDPADDQPLMQTNFGNINSYLQVDHTNPAAPGAGQHEQVTFNSNNVPSGTVSPPVLFTNDVNSLPQLFFYSGTTAQGSTQYVQAAQGSTFLLGGIILKWGLIGLTPNNTTISFPVAFPNNCFSVVLTINDATQKQAFLNVSQGTLTKTGFTVKTINASGSATTIGFYYMAIGN